MHKPPKMFSEFKAPVIREDALRKAAEVFRKKYCDNTIPIDIEGVIERKLNIAIIPLPNLQKLVSSNTLITSDFKKIYIDEGSYMNDSLVGPVRFSLAHELGHWILHKDLYSKFGIKTITDYVV